MLSLVVAVVVMTEQVEEALPLASSTGATELLGGALACPPEDGRGGYARLASADPRHAVELLRDVLLEAAFTGLPVTLVPLGPMTNIALLLRTYPEAARGIERIVFMGGAAQVGNATASAEFNVFHDPEAAAISQAAAAASSAPSGRPSSSGSRPAP